MAARRRQWRLRIVAAAVLWPAGAWAQTPPPAPPPPADDSTEAAKLACVLRHEDAQVDRRQAKLLAARSALLGCSRDFCPPAVRADCIDWLAEVNRSVPSVVVTARERGADVADVRVTMDGELIAARLTGGAFEADPGEHQFRFESPRWPPVLRTVILGEGARNRPIDVDFGPPAPVSRPETSLLATRPLKRSDYLYGGVTLAALATTAVFGGWALEERSSLEGSCAPFCSDAQLSPVRTKLVIADVALGAAVVTLAIGVYRYLTRPFEVPADRSRF